MDVWVVVSCIEHTASQPASHRQYERTAHRATNAPDRLHQRRAVGVAGREGHAADDAQVRALHHSGPEGALGEVALEGRVAEHEREEEAAQGPHWLT